MFQEVDLSFTEHDMSLFRLFIKVLYYGETLLDDENVNTMFGLANKYQVRWLRGRCLNYIAENFSNDEALTLILSGGFWTYVILEKSFTHGFCCKQW